MDAPFDVNMQSECTSAMLRKDGMKLKRVPVDENALSGLCRGDLLRHMKKQLFIVRNRVWATLGGSALLAESSVSISRCNVWCTFRARR